MFAKFFWSEFGDLELDCSLTPAAIFKLWYSYLFIDWASSIYVCGKSIRGGGGGGGVRGGGWGVRGKRRGVGGEGIRWYMVGG